MTDTTRPRFRVLIVEDNPDDADLAWADLKKHAATDYNTDIDVEMAGTLQVALDILKKHGGNFDAIVADLTLPDSKEFTALEVLVSAAVTVPVIVFSGNADKMTALRAIQLGAKDYLVKGVAGGEALTRCVIFSIQRLNFMKAREKEKSVIQRGSEELQKVQETRTLIEKVKEVSNVARLLLVHV
jgi:phosphoserine phosphatase RsbU/P